MRTIFFGFFVFGFLGHSVAQSYSARIDSAHSFIVNARYERALEQYIKAFSDTSYRSSTHLFEAAAMAAIENQVNLSFMLLNDAIDKGWTDEAHTKDSRFFKPVQSDPRWGKALKLMREINNKYEVVTYSLDSIFNIDQKIRREYELATEGFISKTPNTELLRKQMILVDSSNFVIIERIIEQYGILSKSLKSPTATMTIPLILLHSPLKVQEIYLPLMKDASKRGEVSLREVAFLEDKIMCAKIGKQKFGTQININKQTGERELVPLIDPKGVEKYRKDYGLGTLEEYKKLNNIK